MFKIFVSTADAWAGYSRIVNEFTTYKQARAYVVNCIRNRKDLKSIRIVAKAKGNLVTVNDITITARQRNRARLASLIRRPLADSISDFQDCLASIEECKASIEAAKTNKERNYYTSSLMREEEFLKQNREVLLAAIKYHAPE